MRLTKWDKEAFVESVMSDVPRVDYNEQAAKLIVGDVVARLPKKVQEIWKDNALRGFVRCDYHHRTPVGLDSVRSPDADGVLSDATNAELERLGKASVDQRESRRNLRSKLEGAISTCSTLKRAKEILPEFEKYLPVDREATGVANLPAVANLVADLMQAGWPKGEQS